MKCVVCLKSSVVLFESTVLFKHQVKYHKCTNCGSIQTETPYWLDEAYKNAITITDIGLLSRNIELSKTAFKLILNNFNITKRFLDYGGGYGILVRLLRDKGLNFYRQDMYCENIFAVNFDLSDIPEAGSQFELATCFEVIEHTNEPYKLFEELIRLSPNILISTLLVPEQNIESSNDWWYFAPHTGQHITFYSEKGLSYLAKKYNLNFYTNGENLHLFTRKTFKKNPLKLENGLITKIKYKLIDYFKAPNNTPPSLTPKDLNTALIKSLDNNN